MKIRDYKTLQRILGKDIDFLGLLVIIVFGIGLSWFSDGLTGVMKEFLFKDDKVTSVVILVISFLIIGGLFLYKLYLKKHILVEDSVEINPVNAKDQTVKILIVTLSELRGMNEEQLEDLVKEVRSEAVISKAKSWQMPLEALKFHKNNLQWLIVLTSKESEVQYRYFKEIIRNCFGDGFKIHKEVMDINDMDNIRHGYHQILSLFDKYGYKDKHIVYDITSGSKLSTVAGAFFALNNNRLIQYVDTHTYEIKMFNNKYISDT